MYRVMKREIRQRYTERITVYLLLINHGVQA